MSAGRKPLKHSETIDAEATLDKPAFASAMANMQVTAKQDNQEILNGVFALGQAVGTALTAKVLGNFCAAAQIHAFEKINKSKSFKYLPIKMPDGNCIVAQNIDEFCKLVFGRGYRAMADHKLMLERLGEEAYENANRLGLNRTQLRLLINLPEDARAAVDEAMQAGSKSEVDTLILSLANRLDEAKEQVEELKAEQTALEKVSSDKSILIDKLRIDHERVKKLPPDDVLNELHQEATRWLNDTRGALIGRFRQSLLAIADHHETNGGNSDSFVAGLVGQLQSELEMLRSDLLINDITRAMLPEWITDPRFDSLSSTDTHLNN